MIRSRLMMVVATLMECLVAGSSGRALAREAESFQAQRDATSAVQAYENGDFEKAIHLYRSALRATGDNPGWHRGLAMSLMNLGRCDEALPEFRQDSGPLRGRGMARCLGEKGKWAEALVEVRRYLEAASSAQARALLHELELGRDGKITTAEFVKRSDAADTAYWIGLKLWAFWGVVSIGENQEDLRCYPSQASDRHNSTEWPSTAKTMTKAIAEVLKADPGSMPAAYYLACLTYNQWDSENDPTGRALVEAKAILDRPEVRDKDTPAFKALRAELVDVLEGRTKSSAVAKEFEKLVAKFTRGKAVGDLPTATELLADPKAYAGQLALVTVRDPGRVTALVDNNKRCQFELADTPGPRGEFQPKRGRFMVDGAFACPWAEGETALYNFDMLVRVAGVREAVTTRQVKVVVPRLELLVLRFGETVGRK